ncbi:hypothetical protein QBC47DRAFT_441528 [Echria macrotheca]|uniref:Uncharacterized protein n=1 Tax=Echria macrotheca TaxID=438768 RepID=A0AAJ0F846_9PEZI|nr:hypothetical protein QBC47DRAFT_441528 [Echria macrotheca]
MKFSSSIILATQVLAVLAAPSGNRATTTVAAVAASTTTAAAAATSSAAAGAGAGATKEEENKENEVEQQGQFGQVIQLGGGNVKTDTLFPPGLNGVFEVEFQNQQARAMRVTENRNPAAPPAGFSALEPVSYRVEVQGGTRGLTLQKIDYILNANNALDISQGRVGKLCTETGTFIIDGIGELEFERDENELTLTVDSLVGEWAIFVPSAAAGAGAGAGAGAAAGAGNATKPAAPPAAAPAPPAAGGAAGGAANNAVMKQLLEQLLALLG